MVAQFWVEGVTWLTESDGHYIRSSCSYSRKRALVRTTHIMAGKAMTWSSHLLSKRQVLGPRLVRLGCPVQALEGEAVASTSNTSIPKHWWISDVLRPRLPNAVSIPQYTSDAPVGMLRRGKLIHPSCLKGERSGAAVQTPRPVPTQRGRLETNGEGTEADNECTTNLCLIIVRRVCTLA